MPEKVECGYCGDVVKRSPSQLKRVERCFCSPECYNRFQREDYSNSPKQQAVLDYLERNGLSFKREMAESLGVSKKRMAKRLRKMIVKGSVSKVVDGPHIVRYDISGRHDALET